MQFDGPTTPEPQEGTMTETRAYESFSIRWDRGSTWTGYDTRAEAEATIAFAATKGSGATGWVERKTWTVEVRPEMAHLYRPGI